VLHIDHHRLRLSGRYRDLERELDVERKARAEDCAQNPHTAQLATYFKAKVSSDQIFEH
jgi:hypothetical protein